jgi:hypothetical protein
MRQAAIVLAGVLWAGEAMANSWLCVGDLGAGFAYVKGKWKPTIFADVASLKIILRTPTPDDKAFLARPNILPDRNPTWIAIPLGEPFPTMACNPAGNPTFIICEGVIQELRLNTSTLRFQYTYRSGYIDTKPDTDQSGDDPKMAIGLCSAIA